MRTQVGILGAGPAGLLLAHLLHLQGIESVVIERRDRAYVESRIRAGVLEHGTAELLREAGVGTRMDIEGMRHDGIELLFNGERHRIDLTEHANGRSIMVYGQHEVVRDLIAARLKSGMPIHFEADAYRIDGFDNACARIFYRHDDVDQVLECDYVVGCDGFHGISRHSFPREAFNVFERVYPFAWLGILADAPPVSEELIYAAHPNGFALFSMRSPQITRLYLQCEPDENIDEWPDERVWDELSRRLDTGDQWKLTRGSILQKSVTPMRSFVAEPMQYGRLFLAGDAAHIVPPTGAKGMNLAVADVLVLSRALTCYYKKNNRELLDHYTMMCLKRVWRAEHFSYWMTTMLHRDCRDTPFDERLKKSQLNYIIDSPAASRMLAENYVGLPW